MRETIFKRLRVLFVLSLCLCMLLGTALTLIQFAGAILQIPELITASERLLLRPTIAAAAAFGLFSFFAAYFQPSGKVNDEEAEEI